MADITEDELLVAVSTLLIAVDDIGIILVDESFVDNDEEFYNLFMGKSTVDQAHGLLISYVGFTQKKDGSFAMEVEHRLALEFLYPYIARPDIGGKNSHKRFRIVLRAIRKILNANVNIQLGFGGRVEMQPLQAELDWVVRRWGGGSTSKKLTHYASMGLKINVSESTC